MNRILSKDSIKEIISIIQELYLEDNIPWICGYSGGKDSTAVLQLIWMALKDLEPHMRNKTVHVISTDTLVESPVVAYWATQSLDKMRKAAAPEAKEDQLPIVPHRLTPRVQNTFWVNLIGRGYPCPRANFRWCTDRLKIDPSNCFIKEVLEAESEAILVLGTRKAESATRKAVMEGYEKKRYREHLSPNGSFPNTYVFSPIENWTDDNVWQFLMMYPNPWGHSNKDLLSMYSGASSDGECPLVIDTSTPSCGNSRFGCWVCTMVSEDKSMQAMIHNDEEKAWMLSMLKFRNYIAANVDETPGKYKNAAKKKEAIEKLDWARRDFRRMNGRLKWHINRKRLIHGPYKKEVREDFLRRLLQLEKDIHQSGPPEVRNTPLITIEELRFIRKIWLNEKHEFDDSLPRIYQEVTGKEFIDSTINSNKYYGQEEWEILRGICDKLYPEHELMMELQSALLDIEAKSSAINTKYNVVKRLEEELERGFYQNELDATQLILERRRRQGLEDSAVEKQEDEDYPQGLLI